MKDTILWIYIVLLVAGGLMGYIKARSKASLIASIAFAAVLSLCALKLIDIRYAAEIVLIVLLVFFGLRFAKGRKFMPAGLMTILTVVTLALRQLVK
jgi:uncharacterized membrane protein (UPF0136 family)